MAHFSHSLLPFSMAGPFFSPFVLLCDPILDPALSELLMAVRSAVLTASHALVLGVRPEGEPRDAEAGARLT